MGSPTSSDSSQGVSCAQLYLLHILTDPSPLMSQLHIPCSSQATLRWELQPSTYAGGYSILLLNQAHAQTPSKRELRRITFSQLSNYPRLGL